MRPRRKPPVGSHPRCTAGNRPTSRRGTRPGPPRPPPRRPVLAGPVPLQTNKSGPGPAVRDHTANVFSELLTLTDLAPKYGDDWIAGATHAALHRIVQTRPRCDRAPKTATNAASRTANPDATSPVASVSIRRSARNPDVLPSVTDDWGTHPRARESNRRRRPGAKDSDGLPLIRATLPHCRGDRFPAG